jgi:hypothetical protein
MYQFLGAQAEAADVMPNARNSREVLCVYSPPQFIVEEAVEHRKFIHI